MATTAGASSASRRRTSTSRPGLLIPPDGVYAGWTRDRLAAISVGTNPQFDGVERRVEAHLLDFDDDLYDQRLVVEIWSWLRGQLRFDSVEALVEQIGADVGRARERDPAGLGHAGQRDPADPRDAWTAGSPRGGSWSAALCETRYLPPESRDLDRVGLALDDPTVTTSCRHAVQRVRALLDRRRGRLRRHETETPDDAADRPLPRQLFVSTTSASRSAGTSSSSDWKPATEPSWSNAIRPPSSSRRQQPRQYSAPSASACGHVQPVRIVELVLARTGGDRRPSTRDRRRGTGLGG